ncbi:MAG: DUF11 domain-containing protein [Acidobacteriota bacterium]|jgi:uncharacterized repeat protein (TIGR01451 family)
MTPSVRCLVSIACTLLLVGAWAARPTAAAHGSLSVARAPGGPVPAGTTLHVTAVVENTSDAEPLAGANLGGSFTDPLLAFVPGSVTARYREGDGPVGTVARGDDPGDDGFLVLLDPVPPGWHVEVRFRLRAAARLPAGEEQGFGQVSLAFAHDGGAESIPAYLQVPIEAEPALELSKYDFERTFTPGGEPVTYNVSVRNTGSQGATGLVLTDAVPEDARVDPALSHGAWTCAPGTGAGSVCTVELDRLAAGDTRAFGLTLELVPETVPADLERIRNVARVRDDGANTTGSDAPKQAYGVEETPVVATPDLQLSKSDDGVRARPGERIIYHLAYRNHGTRDARGVVLEETVPAHTAFDPEGSARGWSCSPAAGGPGATCTLAVGEVAAGGSAAGGSDPVGSAFFAVRVDDTLPADVHATVNAARIRGLDPEAPSAGDDLDPSDNLASESTPLDASAVLRLDKTDGGATARPGETLVYTLTVRNEGDRDATGVVLGEAVPRHAAFDAGASDAGWSCETFVVAPAAPLKADRIQSPLRSSTLPLKADRIQAPDTIRAGEPVTACSLAVGDLAAGASVSVPFAVTLPEAVPAGVEALVNGALARDGSGAEDDAGETTPVAASVDLALVKSDGGATARPGETLVYTLTVRNEGDQDASGVVVEDLLPEGTRFAPEASGAGWSCGGARSPLKAARSPLKADRIQSPLKADRIQTTGDSRAAPNWTGGAAPADPAGTVCRWPVGALPAGASRTLRLAVTVDSALPAGLDRLENRAVASDDGAGGPDADPADDEARTVTPIEPIEPPPSVPGGPDQPDQPSEPDQPGPPSQPDPADPAAPPRLDLFLSDRLAEDRDGSGDVSAGDVLSYAVRVRNLGAGAAAGVVFEVPELERLRPLPGSVRGDGTEVRSPEGAADGVPEASTLEVRLPDLPAGAAAGFAWDAAVDDDLPPAVRRVVARGTVAADGLEPHPSDDPATAAVDDPTVTPLGEAIGPEAPGAPVEIPTLTELGSLLLSLLLALTGWRMLR